MVPVNVTIPGQAASTGGTAGSATALVTCDGGSGVSVGVCVGVKVIGGQLSEKFARFESTAFGVSTLMRPQPFAINPGSPIVYGSVATGCVPATRNVKTCTGPTYPSSRVHWYVTFPAALVVIVPSKLKVCGQVVLEVGETVATTLNTAKGGRVGVAVAVAVGVKVGAPQFNVKFACGDNNPFGDMT